jgi:hypothetical protein
VSAIDSLGLLADALKAAKPGLLQLLKGAGLSKEVDAYYSRTVDAAADLRDAIYLGAAKRLLPVRQQPSAIMTRYYAEHGHRWRNPCFCYKQRGDHAFSMHPNLFKLAEQ